MAGASIIGPSPAALQPGARGGPGDYGSGGPTFAAYLHHVPALTSEATLRREQGRLGDRRRSQPSRRMSELHQRVAGVRKDRLDVLRRRALCVQRDELKQLLDLLKLLRDDLQQLLNLLLLNELRLQELIDRRLQLLKLLRHIRYERICHTEIAGLLRIEPPQRLRDGRDGIASRCSDSL